jgi:hypothetical protein
MPKVSDFFPPDKLKATELTGSTTVIIRSCLVEKDGYNGATDRVLDIEMNGQMRDMRVSATLARDIVAVLGDDESLNWINKPISIYPSKITINDRDTGQEKTVDMIRAAAAPEGTVVTGEAPRRPAASTRRSDMDDDIPF